MSEHPRLRTDLQITERAIILQLLRDDHDERWTRAELHVEASDMELSTLNSAFELLERHGIAVAQGEYVLASRCARHLDELGLVGV
jgi:hypothetical protein